MRNSLLAVFVLPSLSACSSIDAHIVEEFGHPYSGAESAWSPVSCKLAVSATALFIPAPFILADIPLSVLLDTVFLPVDLIASPELPRKDVVYSQEDCLEGMAVTQ